MGRARQGGPARAARRARGVRRVALRNGPAGADRPLSLRVDEIWAPREAEVTPQPEQARAGVGGPERLKSEAERRGAHPDPRPRH